MKAGRLLALMVVITPAASVADTLVLRNARIFTVRSGIIERGGILIRDGKIASVGKIGAVSPGATVIDLAGKAVMPGIVDANARFGMSRDNEEAAEVTPGIRAKTLADLNSPEMKRALQAGVTTACFTPGSANVIGGICGVVKTGGRTRAEMSRRESPAVRASLGQDVFASNNSFRGPGGEGLANITNRRPNSRMAAVWELRKALFEADRYPALAGMLAGKVPLRIHARTENDIRVVFTLMDEFNLKRVILDDAVEAYQVADQIAARRIPVVLGPFSDPQSSTPEGTDALLNTAGLLASKGIRIAFGSNGGDPGQLLSWAALAVRNGLSSELALRAITLSAAEIAGVADSVGSIEPGKDGDLLILSGDPLQITSRVEKVIIRGQVVHHDK